MVAAAEQRRAGAGQVDRASTVTIIVHGTFAQDERWWKLAEDGSTSFADHLEVALAQRGVSGTVWRPVLAAGMGYAAYRWSGENRDRDRRAGAKSLRGSLAELARRLGASRDRPIVVNLVAHSHGGNVVLEVLRRLPPGVRIGNVVLLGTPLISVRPRFRLWRAALLAVMFLLLLVIAYFDAVQLVALVRLAAAKLLTLAFEVASRFALEFETADKFVTSVRGAVDAGNLKLAALTPLGIALYGWLFWMVAWYGDLLWMVLGWPWLALRGRWAGQAYGPTPGALSRILEGRRIHLFTSHHDEAGLALLLSTAPSQLYRDEIRARFGRLGRLIEWIAVRPIVDALLLRVIEVPLERVVLGFSFSRLLLWDYEMVKLDTERVYAAGAMLEQLDVTEHLRPVASMPAVPAPGTPGTLVLVEPPSQPVAGRGVDKRAATLRQKLKAVTTSLAAQVKLCHSGYYLSPFVIERVADALAGRAAGESAVEGARPMPTA